jgi:ferredoxin
MNIETLRLLYFSPTQTTKKVLNAIAGGFKPEAVVHSDLTLPDSIRSEEPGEEIRIDDGLTIIGVPVYAGRVAPEAARRIRQFKADGTPAVLVVLKDKILTETGACIVCCACVKNCPTGARVMKDPKILAIAEWLWENYNERKEPEMFLGWDGP